MLSFFKVLIVFFVLVFVLWLLLRYCCKTDKSNPKHVGEGTLILLYKLFLRRTVTKTLMEYFKKDKKKVDEIMRKVDVKLREVVKKIPYIGKGNTHAEVLIFSSVLFVPVVLVLKEENVYKADIEELERRLVKSALNSVPFSSYVFWLMGKIVMSFGRKVGKRDAQKSSKWEFDWCWDYLEGEKEDGEEEEEEEKYIFQLRYTKCGILTFWKKLGIEEYLPAACSVDYAMFHKAGIKMVRTKTLSMGCDCCDFKFYGPVKDIEDLIPPEVDRMPDWKNYIERKNNMEKEEEMEDVEDSV